MKFGLLFSIPFWLALQACSTVGASDLTGLWRLGEVQVDQLPLSTGRHYVLFEENNVFSVSTPSRDITGVFEVKNGNLYLKSEDRKWYNTRWEVRKVQGELMLSGKGTYPKSDNEPVVYHQLNTTLRLQTVDKLPSVDDFSTRLEGRWQLYKIRKRGKPELVRETVFDLDGQGEYRIYVDKVHAESGSVFINRRHRRIFFEREGESWNIFFIGDELRMENPSQKIQYSLRRI